MSDDPRIKPPLNGPEADILLGWLDWHRETLLLKADGLDAAGLTQALAPSTMTLGGLLKHMAFVEDWWLQHIFAGEPMRPPFDAVDWDADEDWEWHTAADDTPDELRALLEGAIANSRQIIARALDRPEGLDALSAEASHRLPDVHFNLRWILVHMIEEYARHNGHADLLRESVDGVVGT